MNLWQYAVLGTPLAFASLPLYVLLPHYYAARFGTTLGALGAVLLTTRTLDAFVDPVIGRWVDRLFAHGGGRVLRVAALAAAAMTAGFAALWFPLPTSSAGQLVWLGAALLITYAGFSTMSIVHQAWGARWGGSSEQRARIVASREAAALVGVLIASAMPALAGFGAMSILLAAALVLGVLALGNSGVPAAASAQAAPRNTAGARSPWSHAPFRWLLLVFAVNGIAAAIPATLLPFFVRDRLQVPQWEPLYLGSYFACAALGMPMWVRIVRVLGLARAWLLGMALSVIAFAATPWLQSGDSALFLAVCAASGLALGADLVVPSALLAGVVREVGAAGMGEGIFFGWWTCTSKLNLALAAGLALPLLSLAGYSAGARSDQGLMALGLAYAGLPCLLKLCAAATLWRARSIHIPLGENR